MGDARDHDETGIGKPLSTDAVAFEENGVLSTFQ